MELYQVDYLGSHGQWLKRWEPVPEPKPLWWVIRSALLNALAYTNGDQTAAAIMLGITTKTMGYQMATHQIPGATQIGDVRQTKGLRRHLPKTRRPKES